MLEISGKSDLSKIKEIFKVEKELGKFDFGYGSACITQCPTLLHQH